MAFHVVFLVRAVCGQLRSRFTLFPGRGCLSALGRARSGTAATPGWDVLQRSITKDGRYAQELDSGMVCCEEDGEDVLDTGQRGGPNLMGEAVRR